MSAVKSVDESIACFFSKAGSCTTRIQCDAFTSKYFGGPIEPVATQGLFSYSVSAANGTILVQFRDPNSAIDTEILEVAQTVHPDFVTGCKYLGRIGSEPGLLIYSMKMIPGDTYFNISLSLDEENVNHQLVTVRSLAKFVDILSSLATSAGNTETRNKRFFAQSWNSRGSTELSPAATMLQACYSAFNKLINRLPKTFHKAINHVQFHLPELFSGTYPLVVTHSDLSEMNILVNPETGDITGIVDWAGAGVMPFGFTLYALHHFLGYMERKGEWVYHKNAKALENEFWNVFCAMAEGVGESEMKLVNVAKTAGLLLCYGEADQPPLELLKALIPAHLLDGVLDDDDANNATA